MPDNSIFTSTQPGAGCGRGYSRIWYFPGSTSVAARTPWADIREYSAGFRCDPIRARRIVVNEFADYHPGPGPRKRMVTRVASGSSRSSTSEIAERCEAVGPG